MTTQPRTDEATSTGVTSDALTGTATAVLDTPRYEEGIPEELQSGTEEPAAPRRPFITRTWVRLTGGILASALLFGGGFGVGWVARDPQAGPEVGQVQFDDLPSDGGFGGGMPGDGSLPALPGQEDGAAAQQSSGT